MRSGNDNPSDFEIDLINQIKADRGISHCYRDFPIHEAINACLDDLEMVGVRTKYFSDPDGGNQQRYPLPALILNAVKLWCRADLTDDPKESADWMIRYEKLKASLMMSSEYRMEVQP